MKKLFIATSVLVSCFSLTSKAQTFQTGSLIVSAGYGFDIYSVKLHQVNNFSGQSKDTTSGAASGNFTLGGEFGVTKWLGLGLQLKFDSYLHNSNVSQAVGFEGGLIVNAHIIRHMHFDLLAGLNLGASSLTLTSNDGTNTQIYGSGSWVDIHFTARIYFGKFGLSATLYFPSINYTISSNNDLFNQYIDDSWKATGEGLNIGIQYHFLK
jgi:hypothetical protein